MSVREMLNKRIIVVLHLRKELQAAAKIVLQPVAELFFCQKVGRLCHGASFLWSKVLSRK